MQVLDVCRNARNFGIEITFATANGGALEEDFQNSGARFIKLSRKLPVDLHLVLKLRKIIKEREIQIVHGYQAVESLHLYLAIRGLKNVLQVLSFQGFIADKKNLLATKFLIPRMDANIAVSDGLKNWLKNTANLDVSRNFHTIYNGADAERLQPSGKSLRKELGLSEDAVLFGMIGNFYVDPRKDQFTLCRSLPKVFAEIENAHCIFAGKTENGAEAKFQQCVDFCKDRGIAGKVHFLGGRGDIPDILDALDLFVFSSLHEGLPIAVSEAMLAKVPMIVSDIEPLLEATNGGKCAEVFAVKNYEELAGKILKLLKNKILRGNLSETAYRFAIENFSIEAHLRNLKKLYENLLKENGK